MHDTAYWFGTTFFARYLEATPAMILDVGSADVNGSLRSAAPPGWLYVGVDIAPGKGVDIVLEDPCALPFPDQTFQAVVSTSCFEHDPLFWLTFLEMARVTAPGGYIYVNSPSDGAVHRYPLDCWRFYPDAAYALAAWASRKGVNLTVLEAFVAPPEADVWHDCVMVFGRDAPERSRPLAAGRTGLVKGLRSQPLDAAHDLGQPFSADERQSEPQARTDRKDHPVYDEFLKTAAEYKLQLSAADPLVIRQLFRRTNLPYSLPPLDPFSPEYRAEVLAVYEGLTSAPYDVGHELTSTKQTDALFQIGYPWHTGDLGVVTAELAKTVQATRAMHVSGAAGPVLEFGAGWGNLAIPLANTGHDVTAVDIDAGFIARLRRLAAEHDTPLKVYEGSFLDAADNLEGHFKTIIFQSSFHHCVDFILLLQKIEQRLMAKDGNILFLSEPISNTYTFPWGIRYDGESLWAVMFNKWLELAFTEDFFVELLLRTGLVARRVPQLDGLVGGGYQATRASEGILFAELVLPAAFEAGFFPADADPAIGRFMRANGDIPAWGRSTCTLTVRNHGPVTLKLMLRSGPSIIVEHVEGGAEQDVTIPISDGLITFACQTFVPDAVMGNGDRRELGLALRRAAWTG